jgi:hypothetical protein
VFESFEPFAADHGKEFSMVSKIQQTCKPDSKLLLCARRVLCADSLPSELTQCEEANSQAKPGMCSWPHCGLFGAYLCMYHEE